MNSIHRAPQLRRQFLKNIEIRLESELPENSFEVLFAKDYQSEDSRIIKDWNMSLFYNSDTDEIKFLELSQIHKQPAVLLEQLLLQLKMFTTKADLMLADYLKLLLEEGKKEDTRLQEEQNERKTVDLAINSKYSYYAQKNQAATSKLGYKSQVSTDPIKLDFQGFIITWGDLCYFDSALLVVVPVSIRHNTGHDTESVPNSPL